MIWLRSGLYHLLFVVWTLVLAILYLPLLAGPARTMQRGARFWVTGAQFLQRTVLGLSWELRGGQDLPKGAAIIAAKHQSAWETLIFHRLLDDPAFVLKRELLRLPFIGWYLAKSGQIAIDRGAGTKALTAMARAARAVLARGGQIIVFPEGHRQAPGVAGTYLPGVALLYGEADVPMIPVALNSGLFWGRNAFIRRPGRITMEILPPMPPGLHRRDFMDQLKTRIESATRALEAEALARFPHLAPPGRTEP
jgi:1-acyl-sn-glycerol-3-phosphate acyltransferase